LIVVSFQLTVIGGEKERGVNSILRADGRKILRKLIIKGNIINIIEKSIDKINIWHYNILRKLSYGLRKLMTGRVSGDGKRMERTDQDDPGKADYGRARKDGG
jgi:hypothetical protein